MLVTVASYSFPYEAQIAWSKLDSAGIPAYIADQHTINMQWLYSDALGGVRLQVPSAYLQQARDLLAENLESDLVAQEGWDSTPCPKCGSADTEYCQFGKRIAFLMFLGLDFPLFPVKDGIRCRACGAKSRITNNE